MDTVENPRAVAGGNFPPDTDPLIVETQERIDNANRWLTERPDWEKWDSETADKANFFVGQIQATFDALDGQRLQEGRDFKKKQDGKYKTPLDLLALAKTKLADLRRKWLKREEDRVLEEKRKAEAAAEKARQEAEAARLRAEEEAKKKGGDPLRAEQAAREAEQKAADAAESAGALPERAQIKGAYSTRAAGLRDVWSAEITDISLAFKHYNKKGHPAKATLEAAIRDAVFDIANAEAKRVKDESAAPPGIKFIKDRR